MKHVIKCIINAILVGMSPMRYKTENLGSSIPCHIDKFSLVNLTVSKTTSLNSSPRQIDEFELVTLSKACHFVITFNRIYKLLGNSCQTQ